jgi:hypothetical protein
MNLDEVQIQIPEPSPILHSFIDSLYKTVKNKTSYAFHIKNVSPFISESNYPISGSIFVTKLHYIFDLIISAIRTNRAMI